ncbi:MAG: PIN domain-containing protein [Pseudomonadales bacterium]|nr:PIN domain-containing protein [Pseudomonadales bacterium]
MLAIVDAGPLLAAANSADPDHSPCVDTLTRGEFDLLIPTLCVAEVSYFLGHRHGAAVEASFVEGLAAFHVVAPEPEDWVRIGELVRKYDNLPLDTVDASVVVLAERM